MKKMFSFWLWGILSVVIVLAGCSVNKTPTTNKVPGPEITMKAVSENAPPLTTATLKLSVNSLTSYEQLKQSNPSASSSAAGTQDATDETYRFENGFHIWEGNIVIPEMEDIWQMNYIRKIQFRVNPEGPILVSPDNADFMYSFFNLKGKYGFGRTAPESGVIFDHFIEGNWHGLLEKRPTFNGTGEYKRIWKGYYNDVLTELETRIDFQINDLTFRRDTDYGYLLEGEIVATLPPFSFRVIFDGTPTAVIYVYQYGLKVGQQTFEVPNLYGWDIKNGLPVPSMNRILGELLDPNRLISVFEPINNN